MKTTVKCQQTCPWIMKERERDKERERERERERDYDLATKWPVAWRSLGHAGSLFLGVTGQTQ